MKQTILLWLLICWVCTAFSQTVTITDLSTERPIDLATLISRNPKKYVTTNTEGQADISDFKTSENIEIRTLGYKTVNISYADLAELNFQYAMEPFNLNLNEVVVSGTRWKQSSDNVPSKIVAITPRDVALQNPQTAADMLAISGKVYIQKSQQGGGSPVIRGFATNRLLYTVDGVRMNSAIFRGGNVQNVLNVDPFATESTEVLFGPGSVIYGSDAIGGVMSFQTLTPQHSLTDKPLVSGKAVMRYASANKEQTGHFDVNVGWKKWAFVTSISAWDFDNLRQGSHGPEDYLKPYYVQRQDSSDIIITQDDPLLQIPSAYSQMNIMQKVRFSPNKNWDIQYGFHFSETSPYGRYDRHNRTRNGTARYALWDYGPQKWMMNNLSISNTQQTAMYDELSLRLAQQTFEESRIERLLNNIIRTSNSENVEAYSVNLDLKKSTGKNNSVFYGFEYVLNDVTSTGQVTNISTGDESVGPARYPNATWQSIAAYINDEYRASDKLTLQTGLRYNQFIINADFENNQAFYPLPFVSSTTNSGALTGSLGTVYRPAESWVVSANFGTAFRAPNVDDIGKTFDSEPGSVTVPNPNLEAEYAYNVDVGVAKVFGGFMKIDLTAYYTILNNAIVRRDYQLNGLDSIIYDGQLSKVQALQNVAVANVYGLQAGIEIKLPAGFQFSTDLNYQVGEEELEDGTTSPSRHAAPFFGVSRLSYEAQKLNLQLYINYQGERTFEDMAVEERAKDEIYAKDENGNNYSPAWYTLNLKAQYQLSKVFSVSAGIENITDQRYRPYSSGISAPGRNFIFALNANF